MTPSENEAFNKANEAIHLVETQWHFPIMTKYGFEPLDKEKTGFVRSYRYAKEGHGMIVVTTGCSADYWNDDTNKAYGYWASLEPHVKQLVAIQLADLTHGCV